MSAENAKGIVKLKINNLKCTVEGPYNAHVALVDGMALPVKGAHFSPLYKSGNWDGMKRFYTINGRKFDTGLIRWAKTILVEKGYEVHVEDCRVKPVGDMRSMEGFATKLRDYQEDTVAKAIKATRGILCISVGGGKTEIALAIMHTLNLKSIFIVNSIDLLNQTAERIQRTIPSACVQVIGEGKQWKLGEGDPWLYVATMQTLFKKPELIKGIKFDVKISDECHGVAAKTWKKVMDSIDAYYSYGLSGSFDLEYEDPIRYREITGSTGKPIVTITTSELVWQGHLVKPKITMLQYYNQYTSTTSNYNTAIEKGIVKSEILNKKIIPKLIRKLDGNKLMILVRLIQHGHDIVKTLTKMGINCAYVNGANSGDQRTDAIQKLRTGQINVLVASNIFNQGVDIPEIDAILNLGCDKSYKGVFQKLGRGLRLSNGKDVLQYFDIWPVNSDFLHRSSMEREEKYKYLGFKPDTVDACRYLGIPFAQENRLVSVKQEPIKQPNIDTNHKPKETATAYWDKNKQKWVQKVPEYVAPVAKAIPNTSSDFIQKYKEKIAKIREDKKKFLLNKIK